MSELSAYEIIALMKHHLGMLDPNPHRMIELANELIAARARERKASAEPKAA